MPEIAVNTGVLDQARALVAELITDDLTDAGPDEDLRDYGLDSVRAMTVLATLRAARAEIDFADLIGAPTLSRIATALSTAPLPVTTTSPEGTR